MSLDPDHWSSPNGCHPDCPACAEEENARIDRAKERFTLADWKHEVASDNTTLSYGEWVGHMATVHPEDEED